jgi:hypothetical protein
MTTDTSDIRTIGEYPWRYRLELMRRICIRPIRPIRPSPLKKGWFYAFLWSELRDI